MKLLARPNGVRPFFMLLLMAVMATAMTAMQVTQQPAAARTATETLDIGDEPGRISTEEVKITEGPFARQMVFFAPARPRARWWSIPLNAFSIL